MKIDLNPKFILRALLIVVGIITIAHIGVNIVRFNYYLDGGAWSNNDYVKVLIHLFDLDTENNVPSFYSSLALLFSSILLYLIALYNKRNRLKYFAWILLSVVFFYLSLDEILELHEHLVHLTERMLNLSGYGTAYWVIPYGVLVVILLLSLFGFLNKLPKSTLKLFILSGFIFVSGAVGMEIIGGIQEELHGKLNVTYVVLITIEEVLEMLGIVVFIYALTSYKKFTISIN
ncbi:hypothetical protein K8352_10585 [Flavobacteriaceae bacterium F89]|uniref:Uncharacterized protein n=1 Tax=Cerina litoralis TaxID=2874477 RepID=A0AAE3EU76_9FLAO|nr:hypothetical protein [Cerina litoralis]MCG2461195.1 hypothetical protein [Cerina litoralis]